MKCAKRKVRGTPLHWRVQPRPKPPSTHRILKLLVDLRSRWQSSPCRCNRCGHLIPPELFCDNQTAWCSRCKAVQCMPLLKMNDWVLGAFVFMLIKVHAGI